MLSSSDVTVALAVVACFPRAVMRLAFPETRTDTGVNQRVDLQLSSHRSHRSLVLFFQTVDRWLALSQI